jgi:fused signal recognition particle receptor
MMNLWQRFTQGLTKSRQQLSAGLQRFFARKLSAESLEELEEALLMADIGAETTAYIINLLKKSPEKNTNEYLREILLSLLAPCEKSLTLHQPLTIILMTGINGAGKTTSIGKLAFFLKSQKFKVMMAAGDTFRAAAVAQLKQWGERLEIPVIAQGQEADPAAVLFDACEAAKARGIQVLLADTAGRLHTQGHLMQELAKIKRSLHKSLPGAPHETWLVLDASIGQNALRQAKEFNQAIGITGLILTKLDGTAKGGIVFSIAKELSLPIYFIGIGEQAEDLTPFSANAFVDALLPEKT